MTGPARPDPSVTAQPDENEAATPAPQSPETSEADSPGTSAVEFAPPPPQSDDATAAPAETSPAAPSEEPSPVEAPAEEPAAEDTPATPAEEPSPAEAAPTSEGQEGAAPAEPPQEPPAADAAEAPAAEQAPAEAEDAAPAEEAGAPVPTTDAPAPITDAPAADEAEGKKRKKKPKPKPEGPTVADVVGRIGTTSEQALSYVNAPDQKLSRLPRKVREALIADLPGVTAAALLGPAALARHLVASAATGRYRDLFVLWDLFRQFPEDCKPVLAERQQALARGQRKLRAAVRIGLRGRAERVAEDVRRAEGLIWQWLREMLIDALPAVGARPAVAAALLEREPDFDVPVPDQPNERWLAEAAAVRGKDPLPDKLEQALARNVQRLPATVETLRLAIQNYPDRVPALLDRVDLEAPDIGAFLAWARDHDAADRLYGRIRYSVSATAARDRAKGLELWYRWTQRGVDIPLPEALQTESLEDFDLSRPETAAFAARLLERGVELDLQAELEAIAGRNRQLAEKAYEAMVCAGLDVRLPSALENNPIVKAGTRCPKCRAWTWVRPGHEERCPRPEPPPEAAEPDPFELAAAEVSRADGP